MAGINVSRNGIELSLPEIRDGEEAVLKRAYHFGKSIGHPSKMLQCSMRVEKDERTGKTVSRHIQDFGGSDMVYTCPPGYIAQLMQVESELDPFDPNAIDREPNKASIEKLLKLPLWVVVQCVVLDIVRQEVAGPSILSTAEQVSTTTMRVVH